MRKEVRPGPGLQFYRTELPYVYIWSRLHGASLIQGFIYSSLLIIMVEIQRLERKYKKDRKKSYLIKTQLNTKHSTQN